MKVLRNEEGPDRWKKKVYCTGKGYGGGGCGALLEIHEEDVIEEINRDYDGFTSYDYLFICPLCEKSTSLDGRDIHFNATGNSKKRVLERYRKIKNW
jgi:hypothetical protein